MNNVRRLEPLPERYVTREQLADVLNVSVDTIDRMRKAGMPSVVFSKRTRRFELAQAVAWARSSGRIAA